MTLASCEYRINECIYFHSYLCCQHVIFAISLNLICLLQNVFNTPWEKSYLGFLYSLCPFYIFDLPFLSSFQLLPVLYYIWYIIPSYSWLHYAGLISSRLGSCFLSHIFSQMKCRKTEHIMQKYPMNKHFFFAFTNFRLIISNFFPWVGLFVFVFVLLFFLIFCFTSWSLTKLSPFRCCISFGCISLFVAPTLLQNKLMIWFPPHFLN